MASEASEEWASPTRQKPGFIRVDEYAEVVARDKQTIEGVPAAYVCERGTCLAPVTEAAKLEQLLRRKP